MKKKTKKAANDLNTFAPRTLFKLAVAFIEFTVKDFGRVFKSYTFPRAFVKNF